LRSAQVGANPNPQKGLIKKRIYQNQAAVSNHEKVVAESHRELASSRKATELLEQGHAKVHAEVGGPHKPAILSSQGDERGPTEVIEAIRHVAATLQDVGHLQWKYDLYAEGPRPN
jgi:hypothetical protein